MQETTVADSLGARIVLAARLAVQVHLAMPDSQPPASSQKAMIGGTDRRVTDDQRVETMSDER
jgi:hypothetical protein